jgi:hypothetical protein
VIDWRVAFGIFVHVLLSAPGLAVVSILAASAYLASRFRWGKRIGVAGLSCAGYLLILIILFWIAATPDPNAMVYQMVPLFGATLPWSALLSLLPIPLFERPGIAGLFLMFVGLVVVCGGLNCLIFLLLVRAIRRSGSRPTATP